jgi:hypothetical protein
MRANYKAGFVGERAAAEALVNNLPELSVEFDEEGFWLCGEALELGDDQEKWRESLDAFGRKANALLALLGLDLGAIRSGGAIQIVEGNKRNYVLLPELAHFEATFHAATLSATGGGPPPRPLARRAAELCTREPRFERAANMFSEAGEDVVKLYMVMELIERAHGGFPKKHRRAERETFFRQLQVEEEEWVALHRSARPYRHAEPHEDEGPTMTPRQARSLIQHALKLWLTREVPI